jgi:hypothetical protein
MEKKSFTRTELYDLVWSEPLLTISKMYNISDVGLRKICIRLNIPLPKNGHWQKVQYGKKVTKTPLPPADKEEEITFAVRDENSGEIVNELSPLKALQKEIENQLKDKLVVTERLTNPDKLIQSTKDNFNGKFKYTDSDYYQKRSQTLNIKVSKEQESSVLRFLDTFIKSLYERGHNIIVDAGNTYLLIKDEKIKISIREKTKQVKKVQNNSSWVSYDYVYTGKLVFKVDQTFIDREWTEGNLLFENQLSLILAKLEILADILKQKNLEIRLWHEDYERKRQIEKDYQKRKEDDLLAFKDTLNKAERWHKAANLRNYINEVELKAAANNNLTEETKTWLFWARKKADWYDPFVESEDELLNGVDKETLSINRKQSYW